MADYENGKSTHFMNVNVDGNIETIREAIAMTKGFTDATGVEGWVTSYPQIQAATSIQNILKDLKIFFAKFLTPKFGSHGKIDCDKFICHIERLSRREQKPKRSRQNLGDKHDPKWVTIRGLNDLPDAILALAKKLDEEQVISHYLTSNTLNFLPMLEEFRELRAADYENGKSTHFMNVNVDGNIETIREAIAMTKGFTDATGVEGWVTSYPQIQAATSIQNILRDLKIFFAKFLTPKFGSHGKIDCDKFICHIERLSRREQKPKRSRQNLGDKHDPKWVTIRGLNDLPDAILALAKKLDEEQVISHYLTSNTLNFLPMLEEFRELRAADYENGKSTPFMNGNVDGKNQRSHRTDERTHRCNRR